MPNRESVEPVEDTKIPEGFKVTFHTLVGFNTTDRWFTAHLPDGKTIEFGDLDAAINACQGHAKHRPPEPPKDDGSIESSWRDLGYPRTDCVRCGKTVNDDGTKVTWRCSVCGHLVCRECTKTIGDIGREYHEKTLCSQDCWISAGRPFE